MLSIRNRMGFPCSLTKDSKDATKLVCRIHTPDFREWFVSLNLDGTFCKDIPSEYDLIKFDRKDWPHAN